MHAKDTSSGAWFSIHRDGKKCCDAAHCQVILFSWDGSISWETRLYKLKDFLLRSSFSISHSSVKSKYGGETTNPFFSWSKQRAQRLTYWSQAFSLNKYLSFTSTKSHPDQIHSATIGGYTLHPSDTIVATHLWQEWDPRSPASNPSLLSCVSNCLNSFVNGVAYRVYCYFPSKSGMSKFNTTVQQNKYRNDYSTVHNHIFNGFS